MVSYIILGASILVTATLTGLLVKWLIDKKWDKELKKKIADALNKQRYVVKGQLWEEMGPVMQGWPWLGSDCKHFGSPFDYVVIDGMSAARENDADINEIVFVDVKTGNAQLTPTERKIKRCIQEGRVRWQTIKLSDKGFKMSNRIGKAEAEAYESIIADTSKFIQRWLKGYDPEILWTAEASNELAKRAYDMASFNGQDRVKYLSDIIDALEGNPNESNLTLTEEEIMDAALSSGLIEQTAVLTPPQRVHAAYFAFMKKTSEADGDFMKSYPTSAWNQQCIAREIAQKKGESTDEPE